MSSKLTKYIFFVAVYFCIIALIVPFSAIGVADSKELMGSELLTFPRGDGATFEEPNNLFSAKMRSRILFDAYNGVNRITYYMDLNSKAFASASMNSAGREANNSGAIAAAISDDGNLIAFWSNATNIVPGTTRKFYQLYVRNVVERTTTLITRSGSGRIGNGDETGDVAFSPDGRWISFHTNASNLVPGDRRNFDLFAKNLATGEFIRIPGNQNDDCGKWSHAWSPDSTRITFSSSCGYNWITQAGQLFEADLVSGNLKIVSTNSNGVYGQQNTEFGAIFYQPSGRSIIFEYICVFFCMADQSKSLEWMIIEKDIGRYRFYSDPPGVRSNGRAAVMDRSAGGIVANSDSNGLSISRDGRWFAFVSLATNLAARTNPSVAEIFVKHRATGEILPFPRKYNNNSPDGDSSQPRFVADNKSIVFISESTRIVRGQNERRSHIYRAYFQ